MHARMHTYTQVDHTLDPEVCWTVPCIGTLYQRCVGVKHLKGIGKPSLKNRRLFCGLLSRADVAAATRLASPENKSTG